MLFPKGAPREALLNFVRNGKGIVALHSAVDNFGSDDLTELRNMIGGCSAGHPWGHYLAWRFKVEEAKHPITAHLNPGGFSIKDAMFQFDTRTSRKNVRVLVSMDMSDPVTAKDENGTQRGFRTDGLNPVVWVRSEGKGRVFVNCFGNNDEIFWSASMLKLNLAGIQYALGDLKADDSLPVTGEVGTPPGNPTPATTATLASVSRLPEGTVVQVDVGPLLNARPVTTLTAGKLVTWTMGIDGGGKASGYLTMAAAQAAGDKNPKALPDNPLIPASGSRPEMLLHYSNEDGQGNQACVVADQELGIPVPKKKFGHLFLAWTSAEGSSQIKVELSYSDGTSDTRAATIPDYYNDAPANDPVFSHVVRDLAKWGPSNTMTEANHHNIHALDIAPDARRELTSIKIAKSPGRSYLLFWAATGVLAPDAAPSKQGTETSPATGGGMKALWWNNNSFTGEPAHMNVITKFNPMVSDAGAPFPKTTPPLGPEFVSARFAGTFTPKVTGEYKFVSNDDDYVALWVNGVEEIAWSGHTAKDRFSAHSFQLVKDKPIDIRLDYRQDKLGYKLTLRLVRQPDGEQIDFGNAVGSFTPAAEIKPDSASN